MNDGEGRSKARDEIDVLWDDLGAFVRRLRTKRHDHKLTPSQIQALGHLDRQGPLTAKELAKFERVTPQSIAKTVAALEEQGMVTRRADPSDGRAALVTMTELGTSTLHEDRTKRTQWLAEVIDAECTEAERDLLLIAGRILRTLGQDASPPSASTPISEESLMNP
ncbi:MarR family winged helix-turn-helix transcriptional regulator [Rhodococcus erythropolis]|jgi:DNA-binding MarR family transcriptional regulator|uniref:MarR family transcriptional regulator n=1 Tax=Rhodococcus erythropolis TaxID=1833 RepID=A0A8I0ZTF7_RHOER|nr:MarR family transcriptional regulator [Rhodococcus erythropolis]AKD99178.1 MarR family transcriptional regulator [Rhodococcus erythropolis]MBH5145270.1 MarR family transcriptional regulator [Rhodococcus erythropolis]MBS2989554.1 MarR family transcriptional regulator [Rhodococcus erythropolis]